MGRVAAERQERGAGVVTGGDRRMRVAVVVAEQVAAQREIVLLAQAQQMPRQMVIIGSAGILHCDTDRVFAGMLTGRDGRNVDADKLADIPWQAARSTAAGFFGNGEQRM